MAVALSYNAAWPDSYAQPVLKTPDGARLERHAQWANLVGPCTFGTTLCGEPQVGPDLAIDGPRSPEAFNARGYSLLIAGNPDRAIENFDRAIDLNPKYSEALNNRGSAYFQRREFDEAAKSFAEALRCKPSLIVALFNLAQAESARGNHRIAIHHLNTYLASAPGDRDAMLARATSYRTLGMFDEAISSYGEIIDQKPDDPVAWNERCWTRAISARDLLAALADCHEAVRLAPNNCHTLSSRSFVYWRLRMLNSAIKDADAAIRANPQSASAYYIRGLAKLRRGHRTSGNEDIAAAIRLDPTIRQTYADFGVFN